METVPLMTGIIVSRIQKDLATKVVRLVPLLTTPIRERIIAAEKPVVFEFNIKL